MHASINIVREHGKKLARVRRLEALQLADEIVLVWYIVSK